MKEKETIQKELQLSDIETARRIKRQIKKSGGKAGRKIIHKYVEPLSKIILREKLNDFFAIGSKIIGAEKISEFFDIDTLTERDARFFYEDMVLYIEKAKADYRYPKNKKLKVLKKSDYEKGLRYFASMIKDDTRCFETTIEKYSPQAPQVFALTVFPIDSTELAYLTLSIFLMDEGESLGDWDEEEFDEEDQESPPNTISKIIRKLGEAVEMQLGLEQKHTENLSHRQYSEMLVHLRKQKLSDNIILVVGIRLLSYLEECGVSNRYKKNGDGEIIEVIDNLNRDKTPDEMHRVTVLVGKTDTFNNAVRKINERITEELSLHYNPMVVEPLPWKGAVGGGFLPTSDKYRLTLRKVKGANEYKALEKIADAIPEEICNAINTIQSTPFQINERVYNFLEKKHQILSEKRKRLVSIRSEKLLEFKDKYKKRKKRYEIDKEDDEIESDELQRSKERFLEARQKYWDKKALFNKEHSLKKNQEETKSIRSKLQVIKRLHGHGITFDDPIWFVWQMDFRGRIYPVQGHLHPQGDDIAKGLLKFAEAKPLTPEGLFWLRVHGANLYGKDGLDKRPFSERERWTIENEKEIAAAAENPFKNKLLDNAEDPAMFYAFCCEYANWLNNPENFKSTLPISVDGSNNGLQHISALYHDVKSARLVNVLPGEKKEPEDIYKRVAEHSLKRIKMEYDKFLADRDGCLKNSGGYFLIRKKKAEVLYGNFLDDSLKALLLKNIDSLRKTKERENLKTLKNKIKDLAADSINKMGKNQKKKFINFIVGLCRESGCEAEVFAKLYDEETADFKKSVYYEDKDGFAIETIVSPHNFTDERFLDLIDRDMVKPNVMTDSYGTGVRTKQNQIYIKLKNLHQKGKIDFDKRYLRLLANYIGEVNEASIDEVSEASARYMTWCKDAVAAIYKKKKNEERPIEWTTPLKLLVTQVKFQKKEGKEIELPFGRDRVAIRNLQDAKKIDKIGQKSGLAPNFIHSLDSTHMFMAINKASKNGVSSFMTIHDSFATHACDVTILLESLKSEFSILHKEPLMEKLKKEFEKEFEVELPSIDYIDHDFDISQVEDSDYFFA